MVYVYAGGFRAVVRTDLLQFTLMFGGFFLLLFFLVSDYGLEPFLSANLPPMHLTLSGGNSWQYILVWFFIALWTLVSPQFVITSYSIHYTKLYDPSSPTSGSSPAYIEARVVPFRFCEVNIL